MPVWIVYLGSREGSFTLNSRAVPGQKFNVLRNCPFAIDEGDLWLAGLKDYAVLSLVSFVPTTKRLPEPRASYLPRYQAAFLEGMVASCPDPARIVEIGTGMGNSLARMLYGLSLHQDAKIWTIDLLECKEAREHVEKTEAPNWRYEFLTGNSAEMIKAIGEPLDLIYVDGAHDVESVKADIAAWGPRLKIGGVMAFDDYDNPLHGVTAAVDEMMVKPDWERVGQIGYLIAFERRL